MKHAQRILSLLLALTILFALAVPAATAVEQSSPVVQALKQWNGKKSADMGDCYVYPYATTFDATILKGGSVTLQFKQNKATPKGNNDYFYISIMKGSVEELQYEENPVIVEERIYGMDTFMSDARVLGMTWAADSRYPAGDYCLIGFVLDAAGNSYEQEYYLVDLHVLSYTQAADSIEVYQVDDGLFDNTALTYMNPGETKLLMPILYPYANTTPRSFQVTSSRPEILDAKLSYGYVVLTGKGIGCADVVISCGTLKYKTCVVVGKVENLYFAPNNQTSLRKTLCTDMQDKLTITYSPTSYSVYVAWSSTNPKVATVKNGVVTTVGSGETMITATIGEKELFAHYTVHAHELPEELPVSTRTATRSACVVGHCSICGSDNAVNVIEPAIFPDTVPDAWYADAVDYAYENGLMNGVAYNRFDPQGAVTRAQLVTILYRLIGKPEIEYQGIFLDVPEKQWYSDAVEWAAANKIVNGIGDNCFAPMYSITRQQIATILWRYCGEPKAEGAQKQFPDEQMVSDYARDAMDWAVSVALINGIQSGGKTTLSPHETATRAQIAAIMMRFCENVLEKPTE